MMKHQGYPSGPKVMRAAASQILIFFVSMVLASGSALAQQSDAQKPAAKQGKRTTVNFEDQLVEGQTQKPELFYLLQQRNNNFKRLIKLRENFLPEMRKTSEEMNIQGSGS